MTFWKRWTAAAQPRLLDHPLFGTMRFQRGRGGRPSYWEGEARFAPTGNELQLFIDAGEDGPGEPQTAFWRLLEARYQELWPALQAILANAYAGWIPDPPPHIRAGDRFTLEFLSLPAGEGSDVEWELGYACADDDDHTFTVLMRGWTPSQEVRIDG